MEDDEVLYSAQSEYNPNVIDEKSIKPRNEFLHQKHYSPSQSMLRSRAGPLALELARQNFSSDLALHDISPSADVTKEPSDYAESPPARKQVAKKLTQRGDTDKEPVRLARLRPPPASTRNLCVSVPVGKRETVKISCAPAEPNSGLYREIEINVDEESDLASVTNSPARRVEKGTGSMRGDGV